VNEPNPTPLTPSPDSDAEASAEPGLTDVEVGGVCAGALSVLSAPSAGVPSLIEAAQVALEPAGTKKERERSGFVEALVLVLIALVLALTLKTYVAEAYEIKGRSMEPTFSSDQRVVVLKSFYEIHRGDIIVFASTQEAGKDLIKRVVGLPGETIRIVNGKVFINGEEIHEDYDLVRDARELRDTTRPERIPEGRYYVLGDNRPDSQDSRYFDAIPATAIKGKVVVRWWPFSKLRTF
jgi:signal peptidase I